MRLFYIICSGRNFDPADLAVGIFRRHLVCSHTECSYPKRLHGVELSLAEVGT